MAFTLCTSGQAVVKAGANVSSTIAASGQVILDFSNEAESVISSVAAQDVVTGFSTFTSEGKLILQRLCSNMIAFELVSYNSAGFNSTRDFETKLDTLQSNIDKDTRLIKDDILKTYLGVT